MRLTTILFSIFAATTLSLAACGGSSGGDDTAGDDTTDIDANDTVVPDAADTTNTSTELGKYCTGVAGECPADAPSCITLQPPQPPPTNGFCTLTCGSTTTNTMAPAGGNALCAAQYDGTSGTPVCGATGPIMNGMYEWSCVVGCGNFMGTELGTCPNNLQCIANACT